MEIRDRLLIHLRFRTRSIEYAYRIGDARLSVTCGLGTIGGKVRLDAPPEANLTRLAGASKG